MIAVSLSTSLDVMRCRLSLLVTNRAGPMAAAKMPVGILPMP